MADTLPHAPQGAQKVQNWLWENTSSVFAAAILLGFGVWILLILNFTPIKTLSPEELIKEVPSTPQETLQRISAIPIQLIQLHDAWLNEAVFWRRVHYVLAISAIVLSTLVASGSSLLGEKLRNLVAVAAAISTGLLTTLNPYKTYEDFIGAWRIVNVAKLEYVSGMRDALHLIGQVKYAEDVLRESRHYQQAHGVQPSDKATPSAPPPSSGAGTTPPK